MVAPPTYYDPPDTGIQWLDIMLVSLVVVAITISVIVAIFHKIAWKPLREMLRDIRANAATAAEQTANSHQGAPNPNLRDDLDAKHNESQSKQEKIIQNQELQARMLAEVIRAQQRQDKEIGRLNDTVLEDREETRRLGKKLDDHIDERSDVEPRLIKLEAHIEAHREITEAP